MKLAQIRFPFDISVPTVGSPIIDINAQNLALGEIVTGLLRYVFAGAGIILLLNLLFGGISLMLSRGDPKAIEAAKGRITTSLIGFIIVFAAYWVVQLVGAILGVQAIKDVFK